MSQLYFLERLVAIEKKNYIKGFALMKQTQIIAKKINSNKLSNLSLGHIFNLLNVADENIPLYNRIIGYFKVNTLQEVINIITRKVKKF